MFSASAHTHHCQGLPATLGLPNHLNVRAGPSHQSWAGRCLERPDSSALRPVPSSRERRSETTFSGDDPQPVSKQNAVSQNAIETCLHGQRPQSQGCARVCGSEIIISRSRAVSTRSTTTQGPNHIHSMALHTPNSLQPLPPSAQLAFCEAHQKPWSCHARRELKLQNCHTRIFSRCHRTHHEWAYSNL